MNLLAIVGTGGVPALFPLAAETDPTGLQINFFWVIVSAVNFLIFLAAIYALALRPVSRMLNDRRQRV